MPSIVPVRTSSMPSAAAVSLLELAADINQRLPAYKKRGGSVGYESETRTRTISVDRGDFSRLHRARGRHAADDRAPETDNGELGEESSSAIGRAFREPRYSDACAHFAGHALYGAGAVAIRARVACKIFRRFTAGRGGFF